MESTEQTLRSYKNLVLKNKSTLASLSKFISTEKQLFPKTSTHGFQQMKQQYDQALAVSKASIDRNVQLQAELQFKQEKLKALREKYYRHFEEIQGLQFQMKRATGQLKKQLKNRQESSRIILSNEKNKKDVEKLNKKKAKLEQEQGQLALKEKVKRQTIAKIELEIQESERRFLQQQKAQASRIQKLQQQISRQQSIIYSLKRQYRSFTPPKSTGKFDELLLKIQHQKSNLQD